MSEVRDDRRAAAARRASRRTRRASSRAPAAMSARLRVRCAVAATTRRSRASGRSCRSGGTDVMRAGGGRPSVLGTLQLSTDRDAALLETFAQEPRQLGGAGRVAVDAERVDSETSASSRRSPRPRRRVTMRSDARDDLVGVVNDRARTRCAARAIHRPCTRDRQSPSEATRRPAASPARSSSESGQAEEDQRRDRTQRPRGRSRRQASGRAPPCCRARRAP